MLAYLIHRDCDKQLILKWLSQQLPRASKVYHTIEATRTINRSSNQSIDHSHDLADWLCCSIYVSSLTDIESVVLVHGPGNRPTYEAQKKEFATAINQSNGDEPEPVLQTLTAKDRRAFDQSIRTNCDDYNICFYTINQSNARAIIEQYVDLERVLYWAGIETTHRPMVESMMQSINQSNRSMKVSIEIDENTYWNLRHVDHLIDPRQRSINQSNEQSISQSLNDTLSFQVLCRDPVPAKQSIDQTINQSNKQSIDQSVDVITDHVASRWKYSGHNTRPMISRLLRVYDSFGLYETQSIDQSNDQSINQSNNQSTKDLVAYVIHQYYGALGMLNVREDYRGRKVGQLLMYDACLRYMEGRSKSTNQSNNQYDEFTPFCYIHITNMQSQGLFKALGFVREFDIDWIDWTPSFS